MKSLYSGNPSEYRSYFQARSQEFGVNGGLFWRLKTISNDLDPDFDRSSIRLSRFFCRNLDDLQKKKKVFSQVATQFSGPNHTRSLTNSYRQHQGGWEAIFVFSAKIGLKSAKKGVFYILFRPMRGL